jgi:hypothetical protein
MDNSPIHSDDDVLTRVEQLIEPQWRTWRSLWLFFLDRNQTQLPVVTPIDDVPEDPEPELVGRLCWIISEVLGDVEPGGSVVITLTRPGPAAPDELDLVWRDRLRDGAATHGVRIRMTCLATPHGVLSLAAGLGRQHQAAAEAAQAAYDGSGSEARPASADSTDARPARIPGSAMSPSYRSAVTPPGASAWAVRSAAVFPDSPRVLPEISKMRMLLG